MGFPSWGMLVNREALVSEIQSALQAGNSIVQNPRLQTSLQIFAFQAEAVWSLLSPLPQDYFRNGQASLASASSTVQSWIEVDLLGQESESVPNTYFLLTSLATGRQLTGRTNRVGIVDSILIEPDVPYRIEYFDAVGNLYGEAVFRSSISGEPTFLPRAFLGRFNAVDGDGDQLIDRAERVVGTDPAKSDTDGDGLLDYAELLQGSDPIYLGNERIGITEIVRTDGVAKELAVQAAGNSPESNTIFVASGTAGMSILDIVADGGQCCWVG